MSSLTDYIFDTTFLEEVFIYLETSHGIRVEVINSDGNVASITKSSLQATPAEKYIPLDFPEDIGGIKFSAPDKSALEKCAVPIQLCMTAVQTLLQRELELQQTTDEMLQLSEQLNFLFKLSQKTFGIRKIDQFCTVILEQISEAIQADYSFAVINGKWDEELVLSHNISPEKFSELRQQIDFQEANKDNTYIFSLNDNTSALISLIKGKEGVNGTLAFCRSKEKRFFTSYEKKFVSIIEHIISPSVETLKLYDSLQELYLNTVKALAAAIDAKDEYTHGHSFRVAEFSVAIGRAMSISEPMLQNLEIAAYMHDLGKIGISELILGKPGKLTAEEYEEIKKHPTLTNKILQPIRLPAFIVDAAVQHHERLDGRGYPLGLKGDKISQFAKIIAVADVFDAMTSKRPYRDAMPVEKALQIICSGIDQEFDREPVLALITSLKSAELGKPLSHISTELKFEDFINLNNFLLQLNELLVNKLPESQ
jgi:HD-GYP domain-containing protein (c-di-GMP phosphodiesterase class II)